MAEPKVGRWLIYGLLDPRKDTLFYIGKTHRRREIRLQEHMEAALNGSQRPCHIRIRKILADNYIPHIFVLRRLEPSENWREAERHEIRRWRQMESLSLPVRHPAQTRLSSDTLIAAVDLQNVRLIS